MHQRKTLALKNGVRLEQVTLYDGSVPVDTRFVVKSSRTPEVPNFGGVAEAYQYFEEEAARSSGLGPER